MEYRNYDFYYLHFKEYPFEIPDFYDINDIEHCFNRKKKKNLEIKFWII